MQKLLKIKKKISKSVNRIKFLIANKLACSITEESVKNVGPNKNIFCELRRSIPIFLSTIIAQKLTEKN